jgi:hypothetical protein
LGSALKDLNQERRGDSSAEGVALVTVGVVGADTDQHSAGSDAVVAGSTAKVTRSARLRFAALVRPRSIASASVSTPTPTAACAMARNVVVEVRQEVEDPRTAHPSSAWSRPYIDRCSFRDDIRIVAVVLVQGSRAGVP